MQTRRKVHARNATKEHANPRLSRQLKKGAVVPERKVTELIASSTKKQKNARLHSIKTGDESARNLNTSFVSSNDVNEGACVGYSSAHDDKLQEAHDADVSNTTDTIFSPNFHPYKDGCGTLSEKVDFMSLFRTDNASCQDHESSWDMVNGLPVIENKNNKFESIACIDESNHTSSTCDDEYRGLGNISSEVSAIYLAMQHSKLECIDEPGHDTMSTDANAEGDEDDGYDDFDPYLFIKNLPELSTVVPQFRPMLLPKQTRSCPSTTLVLDLDETLVHSTLEPCEDADFTFPVNFNFREHTVYVRCRPHLKDFLEKVASLFEIIIFTASQSIYAEQLLNVLDPKRKLFRHRVYRESCVYVEGNYLKDLSVLGRDLSRIIIVDNSPQAFGFQIDNGIPIESWFDDRRDQELLTLLPFLESLVGVDDVRPLIAKKFNLRDKVAATASFSLGYSSTL